MRRQISHREIDEGERPGERSFPDNNSHKYTLGRTDYYSNCIPSSPVIDTLHQPESNHSLITSLWAG